MTLALTESTRFTELEGVIERGLGTFVEVGAALMEIRDSRLYRETHGTFEDYCRRRWGWSRRQANRTIKAAEVVEALGPIGPTPVTESQARELAPLLEEPENLREVWTTVQSEARPVTAQVVAEARDVFTGAAMSSKTDEWETPQDLFDELDAEFSIALDVCASSDNAKCLRYFDFETDGLAQDWGGTTCWMNPPYGDEIAKWVEKAHLAANDDAIVVCLVPARVDTGWWWDHCRHAEIRFLRGRLKFGGGTTGAPFPSAVVVFGRPAKVVWWERG